MLTIIFRSILRRTALSSRHVHLKPGSNARQFSHLEWIYSSLYSSIFSESQMLGWVAILIKLATF